MMVIPPFWLTETMRTRLRICKAKMRFVDQAAALVVAARYNFAVRPYRCDRCNAFHLTSRRKGKRIPRPVGDEPHAMPVAKRAPFRQRTTGIIEP